MDILVNDKSWVVRYIVAEHERPQDLKKLIKDKNSEVRDAAKKNSGTERY